VMGGWVVNDSALAVGFGVVSNASAASANLSRSTDGAQAPLPQRGEIAGEIAAAIPAEGASTPMPAVAILLAIVVTALLTALLARARTRWRWCRSPYWRDASHGTRTRATSLYGQLMHPLRADQLFEREVLTELADER